MTLHSRQYRQMIADGVSPQVQAPLIPTEIVTIGETHGRKKYRYVIELCRKGETRVVDLLCDAPEEYDLLPLRKALWPDWLTGRYEVLPSPF
jgi:hypothetical protein